MVQLLRTQLFWLGDPFKCQESLVQELCHIFRVRLLDPEGEGTVVHQNVGNCSPNNTVSYLRCLES
jgi:hypothetical protein